MACTPQFYGYILPLIFLVPIFLGVRGCKKRSINGFYMSMSVIPVAIMTAATWIRYGLQAMGDYGTYVKALVDLALKIKIYLFKDFISPYFFGKINF